MNSIETILRENINKPNSLFIFPTDIAASRWADHLLRLKVIEDCDVLAAHSTIPMKKFIAWDVFKQNSVKSKVQNKKSIPSALRKIFINRLVSESAELAAQGKPPVFSSLITAQWAELSAQFAPWLTMILPQLGAWFGKAAGLTIDNILTDDAELKASKFEGDDRDMYVLARRYAQFLEAHSLFEPAWEKPPFDDEGKECFIFFPESLSDFSEYRELLKPCVTTVSAPDEQLPSGSSEKPIVDTFFYTNSRSEITEAALYIRALHEKQNISWNSIAVCIGDSENYEPYVLREFTNRNIPFVKRTSKPLSDYPAGQFFRSLTDCASLDFSFSSLVSLITNKNLPWKDTVLIDKLIQFGISNNCLYSWPEDNRKINVWEDAFDSPLEHFDNNIRKFFSDLKKRILSFRGADSFAELRRQYFIFREIFFDMEKCSEETDLILSRCISELTNLVELEKDFPDAPVIDPLLFLSDYLSEVFYLPQTNTCGVVILPYKTAAAAPFDCHIILGAGQESLSVVYSRLNFLARKKREVLGFIDEDASTAFINMHKFNSVKTCAFFCCQQSFAGFTIPHSKISSPSRPKERYCTDPNFAEKFSQDHYKNENSFFTSLSCSEPLKLHENQLNGFTEWKNRRLSLSKDNGKKIWSINKEIQNIIDSSFAKTGKYSVSATSLQKYFQCSLKWLFERIFNLENVQIETSLMAENISGLVYHAVLNNFFAKMKNTPLPEPVSSDNGISLPDSCSEILENSLNEVFDSFPSLKPNEKSQMSALTARLLHAGKKDYQYYLEKFLSHFLSTFAGCSVAGTESYYQAERGSYFLNGYIDCILKENSKDSDKYIIVDFKLKHLPKRAECTMEDENGLSNFQLPMYITLAEENEKYKIYNALFYSIIDLKTEIIIAEDKICRGRDLYNKIIEEFKNKTEQFADEISTGNFTVFAQESGDCLNCDYQSICRTVYVIDRENNILGKH